MDLSVPKCFIKGRVISNNIFLATKLYNFVHKARKKKRKDGVLITWTFIKLMIEFLRIFWKMS